MARSEPNHRGMALRLLEESYSVPAETAEQAGRDAIATAQVHSQLAIAAELKGIRQTLVAMHTGSPVDAVEASEAQSELEPTP